MTSSDERMLQGSSAPDEQSTAQAGGIGGWVRRLIGGRGAEVWVMEPDGQVRRREER